MTSIRKSTMASAALLLACAGLVGCGGSDSAAIGVDGGSVDGTTDGQGPGTGDGSLSADTTGADTSASTGDDSGSESGTTSGDAGADVGTGTSDGGSAPDAAPFKADAGGSCLNLGGACTQTSDCCSGTCVNNVCAFPGCTSQNQACTADAQCCSGICGTGGTCTPLNTNCITTGNSGCTQSSQCCSQLCSSAGVCVPSTPCGQTGDVCGSGSDCCGGVCDVASGHLYGTCGQPPTTSANCSMVDGTVCGGVYMPGGAPLVCGGSCCSRLCAPYGPTGILMCQPASGCHVVGDLCTKDSDCCGAQAGECVLSGGTLGVCRNPTYQDDAGHSCKPNGDVCKLKTTSCNSSCDCCAGNCETQDTCKPDSVGVPRCANVQCANTSGACASSADCCNGLPCVPNPTPGGAPFVCGTGSCVPTCGACTINADCCAGATCVVAQGSTMGVCGPCNPTPDGGVADGGGPVDGGSPGSDAGSGAPDGSSPGGDAGSGSDAGTCALYGQQCTVNADCCNGVPCTAGRCVSP